MTRRNSAPIFLYFFVSVAANAAAGEQRLTQINILRLSTIPLVDPGIWTAVERFRANTTLSSRFNVTLTTRSGERALTAGIGPTLRIILAELTRPNTTYAFVIGPELTPEIIALGQMTPVYNIIMLGAAGTSKVFSEKRDYPLFFRGISKGPDFTRAFLKLMQELQATRITTMALNEQYAVDGIRDVEQNMILGGVMLQYSAVFDNTNRLEIVQNIKLINPNYIVAVFFGVVEPKIVCDLYRQGVTAEHMIYVIGGPFGIQDWWMPRPTDPEWKCSLMDFGRALNGSFMLDFYHDDGRDSVESARIKIGGLNGKQLNERFDYYQKFLHLPRTVAPAYTGYDIMWAAFDALYRVESRIVADTNDTVTLRSALSSSYQSYEYATYSRIMKEEIMKSQFYGITGDFRFDKNQDRQMDLQIFQFQPGSNDSNNLTAMPLVVVGNYSVRNNVITFHDELVRYATPNNVPPHIWQLTQSERYEQWARTRLYIILIACFCAALCGAVGAGMWLYKQRRQRAADLSWLVPVESVRVLLAYSNRNGSMFSGGLSSRQSITSGSLYSGAAAVGGAADGANSRKGSSGSILLVSASQQHNRMLMMKRYTMMQQGTAGHRRCPARIDVKMSATTQSSSVHTRDVWMRQFPQTLTLQLVAKQVNSMNTKKVGVANSANIAARLNSLFPQAAALRTLSQQHANINRFVGVCLGTENSGERQARTSVAGNNNNTRVENEAAMLFFDYAAKGSLRTLVLYNESFSLDLTLKYSFMHDIATALQFMHAQASAAEFGRAHGFLHTNNVVLDNKFTAKITDYGFWHTRSRNEFLPAFSSSGSAVMLAELSDEELELRLTRAPEVLRGGMLACDNESAIGHTVVTNLSTGAAGAEQKQQSGGLKFNIAPSADIYSLGTIFVEISTRCLPFLSSTKPLDIERHQVEEVLRWIVKPNPVAVNALHPTSASSTGNETIPNVLSLLPPKEDVLTLDTIDGSLGNLIVHCTQTEPLARPSAADVVKHLRALPGYTPGTVVENLIVRLQSYATNLENVVVERTRALEEEMFRSEQLLLQILPPSVANELKAGRAVDPEWFDSVSIYFSDIVGFTTLSAESTPMQVVILLNALYTLFDSVLENFDVYKVETIGDAYMVASGLPIRNETRHVCEIADTALTLLVGIGKFEVPHKPSEKLRLRIGLHCGPCVAGVVGVKMPRYCLFGDTVNTASRMESNGEALKIHISSEFNNQLHANFSGKFLTVERGMLEVKGKGAMVTHWLLKKLT